MKSVSINKKVSLTQAERESIIKSLVSKGIDESLVRSALTTVAAGCEVYDCMKLVIGKADPNSLSKLKREMDAKGIKMTNVDPAVAKLFR